jgi:hypothetical protein
MAFGKKVRKKLSGEEKGVRYLLPERPEEKGVRYLLPERPEGCFAQKVPDTFFLASFASFFPPGG